ncbi:L,D-transpeptidase [Antarcticirhabdus aurantiaca]|uniref:L,D-transpeptidase n=1 Tax=Antarcticirhabdus aurantiaca TaxID=2606717 RepID=A0ACD4NRY9_9HYPH|nr:L,D-transpeptidase [Antarcticirhabdus aurantiaca]WAJ29684.1 L,D-transpeptidase [Jeongeuplla avenae]
MKRFALSFLAVSALAGGSEVALAQGFDPYYDDAARDAPVGDVFIDEYGRRVTLDVYGRVVSVEEPRARGVQRDMRARDENGRIIVRRTPPPGARLEGRVGEVLPGLEPYGTDPYGGIGAGPESADPYYDGPVESQPLPDIESGFAGLPDGTLGAAEPGLDGQPAIVEGQTVRETDPAPSVPTPKGPNAKVQIAAFQVILDRAGISPGVIDGRMGGNVNKAVAAYAEKYGRTLDPTNSQQLAEELDATGGPAITTYEITAEDVTGPYVAAIPSDYGEKAKLPAMSYERVSERLAERFHMDEKYLLEINPGADFTRQGTRIKVMNVGENVTGEVTRIIADKGREQVRAYGADGTLIAAYPSTIGSSDTPSPSGTVEVARIAFDPNYTYNPKINFQQGENRSILTIPPGPNGPVGTIWIALSKPTYGIHGTPEPSQIGKTNSHGCVRLTNWDAFELAKMVKPGVTVEFVE